MKVKAILFDVRSIQKYIYASNRLKTNIGASYIVEHVFDTVLADVIKEKFGEKNADVVSWEANEPVDFVSSGKQCQISYIGGGNALVFINSEQTAENIQQKIVEAFCKKLLVKYPGLHVGAACGELSLDNNFQKDLTELYRKLKSSQNRLAPVTNVPYTGLTLLGDEDGEIANCYATSHAGNNIEWRFCSQESFSKIEASKAANVHLKNMFKDVFAKHDGEFDFPTEIDKLGQKEGENYIAVIHIDGNNMGVKFQGCNDNNMRRKLSQDIRKKTQGSFARLLDSIITDIEDKSYGNDLGLITEKSVQILPIRPLILGGDDVTFICPAKVAMLYSKRFMEYMLETDDNISSSVAKSIDSCGGIAILPTSYPFFRGYVLAEQLCDSAKAKMRAYKSESKNGADSCWIDFIRLHGEQAPTLEQILKQEYKSKSGNMHYGPYRVGNNDNGDSKNAKYNIEKLLECAQKFKKISGLKAGERAIANNKVKELRRILQLGADEHKRYLAQNKNNIPEIAGWQTYKENLWSGERTPYIDAIEMMDFMTGFSEQKKGAEA